MFATTSNSITAPRAIGRRLADFFTLCKPRCSTA